MSLITLDNEHTFLSKTGAIVSITSNPVDINFAKPYVNHVNQTIAGVKAVRWGADGDQPNRILRAVAQNHIKPQLLKTERDFLLGSRMQFFSERFEKDTTTGKNKRVVEPIELPELEDWAEMVDLNVLMRKISYNYVYSHNYFLGVTLSSSKKIESLDCWDFNTILAQERVKGRIENYFYHPFWKKALPDEVITLPNFDKTNPTKFPQFIYHGRDWMPGQPYYDWAPWWGSEDWTGVSNLIPKFHKSGLLNGYNIKYHIEIPKSYFDKYGDIENQKKAENDLKQNMDDFLSGTENVNKAFISKFATDEMGKVLPGFKITPMPNFMSDEAYIKLDNNANINQSSAHGINPSLASIDTGGKLGGSGLELKVAYQSHIAIHTPNDREILTEWFTRVVVPIMGWKEKYRNDYGKIFLGFEDIDLSVPDTNSNPNKTADINNKMG